jgi:hypothetical protein
MIFIYIFHTKFHIEFSKISQLIIDLKKKDLTLKILEFNMVESQPYV